MNKDVLILFLKYPERGAVKTRIAGALGQDLTYELYTCFLADLSVMAREVEAEKIIVYSGPENAVFPDFPGIGLIRQRGKDIGERMYFALSDVFALGFERCVLIGGDSPDLPARLVKEAFDKLKSADVVLGPCTDGGYYLIGCRPAGLERSLFDGIPWSTDNVLQKTFKRAADAGLLCAQIDTWADIDMPVDLKHFYKRNEKDGMMSQTMKLIHASGIIHER
ncbi:MAG TPA: TIGR04282 family arsenosugar biosynthesis glycosyltransferase [Smithellaceae bacterium]|nr:TIGR04282 family arsenosugar biosynthesis glycosyltransferase [Smithellaceae bacterium]HRV45513.1 TIGR04282 family arsenosugar biosynthesis glycosyltransferase [Smithellaceae bacterium]